MAESNTVIWRLTPEYNWSLFNNNQFELPIVKEENAKVKEVKKIGKKEKYTPFYFAKVKNETKGSLVYTPNGYGIIQNIKPDQSLITVKVSNEIQDYNKNDVANEVPVCLTYISNSGRREDKTILSIHATAKDVVERIENNEDGESSVGARIFYQGKELSKTSETLEKMGVVPFSKFLVVSSLGKPYAVKRFTTVYQGWGYSASSVDGVTFSPSRDIRVIGYGIYRPEGDTTVTGIAKFCAGNDAKGVAILSKEVSIVKSPGDPEDKVYRFMFDRQIKVKSGEQYCCVTEFKTGNSYYGSNGVPSVTGDQDIIFTFSECTGSFNGTGPSSGQIPEIYYYA